MSVNCIAISNHPLLEPPKAGRASKAYKIRLGFGKTEVGLKDDAAC